MMKTLIFCIKCGDWEEYKSIFKVEIRPTEWAFKRIREAFEKVVKDAARRLNIAQGIMLKEYRFSCGVLISPAEGQGGVT